MRYPERERRRIEALRRRHPELSETLAFLERITDVASRFSTGSFAPDPKANGAPPLATATFPLDELAAVEVFQIFLQALIDATGNADAGKVLAALKAGRLATRELVLAFCRDDATTIEREALNAGNLDVDFLISLAELAVKPQFVAAALAFSSGSGTAIRRQDRCPLCDSPPELALITDAFGAEGVMMAVCRLCENEWPVQRVRCLACGNEDSETLSYLQADGDEAARLYICELCHHYLPVADVRGQLEFAPAVERAALAHLDILAQTRGLRPTARRLRDRVKQ